MSPFAAGAKPGFGNISTSKNRVMWESIDLIDSRISSDRLKVPGGWLVRSIYLRGQQDGSCALHQIFVADPNHEWVL